MSGREPEDGHRSRDVAEPIAGPGRRELTAACALFALLCLGLFADFLFGPPGRIASNPIGDGARYFVFMRGFYAEQLLGGNIPLWDPHIFSGLPFVGSFQSAVFYPPNLIYLIFPIDTALNLDFALHLFLLSSFSFVWLRRWGLHPAGAIFAGMLAAFSAPNLLRVLAGQLTVLDTLAWSPLLLLSIDALARRWSPGHCLAGILATTMMILAGHPPTAYMAGLVTALYCLAPLLRGPARTRFALSLLPILLLPPLLAAIQLFTGLAVGAESVRSGGTSFEFASSFSLPPENLLTLLVPHAFGDADQFKRSYFGRWFYWDASIYLGLIGLLLAIHGAHRGRGALRSTALMLAPSIVLISLGRYLPGYRLAFEWLPGFDQFRSPSKFVFFAALFTAALAGIGVDRLLREGMRSRVTPAAAALIALLLCLAALLLWQRPPEHPGSPIAFLAALNPERTHTAQALRAWHERMQGGLYASILVFAGATGLLWLGRRRRAALWILVLAGAVELYAFAWDDRGGAWLSAEYTRRPQLAEAYARAGHDRVLAVGKTSDIALKEGGYELWGYDPVMLLRYVEFIAFTQGRQLEDMNNIGGQHPEAFHPLLSMLRLRLRVFHWGAVEEHPDPQPRFLLARRYRVIEGRDRILRAMDEPGFDPRTTVLLERPPSPAPDPAGEGGSVRLLDESSDQMTLEVELDTAAVLVISDVFARGWRALALPGSVQSEYLVEPGNYVLRAIPLAAGHHWLRVEYSPLAYRVGAWTSGVSLVLVLLASALWLRQRRSAPRAAATAATG